MAQKKHFRNFHLLVLNHPKRGEEALDKGPYGNAAKLKFGLADILAHTKPGDLVLIETPWRQTLRDYKFFNRGRKRRLKGRFDETMRSEWESGIKQVANFYSDLKKLVIQKGRGVASLDSGVMRPSGIVYRMLGILRQLGSYEIGRALWKPEKETDKKFERALEANLVAYMRRTPNQIARIDREKPHVVVCAAGHGDAIEKIVKPKSSTCYEEKIFGIPDAAIRQRSFETEMRGLKKLAELRQKRRQRINKELMARGKLPKTRAKLQAAGRCMRPK